MDRLGSDQGCDFDSQPLKCSGTAVAVRVATVAIRVAISIRNPRTMVTNSRVSTRVAIRVVISFRNPGTVVTIRVSTRVATRVAIRVSTIF